MIGFRQEVMHAVAQALAGEPNSHGREWATYLRSFWVLSNRNDVELDPQFILSSETIRQLTRFEDLWDVTIRSVDVHNISDGLIDLGKMMEHYGF